MYVLLPLLLTDPAKDNVSPTAQGCFPTEWTPQILRRANSRSLLGYPAWVYLDLSLPEDTVRDQLKVSGPCINVEKKI